MKMKVEPEYAGLEIDCPGCNTKTKVPSDSSQGSDSDAPKEEPKPTPTSAPIHILSPVTKASTPGLAPKSKIERPPPPERVGWVESDPANANPWFALLIGAGIFVVIYGIGFLAKTGVPAVYEILYERGWVNFAETICFGWGLAILILKISKLKHQRMAMAIDTLPDELGREINRDNVGEFIDYLYEIPAKLRDSMMVNRMRKALELFEGRPVNSEVSAMMDNQSGIDSTRISGSYSLVKLFIAIVPLLGFIGTVLGLSAAIGGFSGALGGDGGADAEQNMGALMDSLKGVTSGLGTAFDTTLLGLLYSILLMIPSSALQKVEDDNLNHIDAYCSEMLLPRLNDGSNTEDGDMSGVMDAMVQALSQAQNQYLGGINKAAAMMEQQSKGLETQSVENQKAIRQSFEVSVNELTTATKSSIDQMLKNAEESVGKLSGAMVNADKYIDELGANIKITSTHVGNLEKNSREQAQLFQSTMEKSIKGVQEESAKVLTETMKTAVTQTTKALESLVRPTTEKLGELGSSLEKATKFIEEVERKSSEQQKQVSNLQKETAEATRGTMKTAGESIASLTDTIKGISGHIETLGKQSQEQQTQINEGMQKMMGSANDNIGKLSEGIHSLNEVLGKLDGKQVNIEVKKKRGFFG